MKKYELSDEDRRLIIKKAFEVRKNAYAPYSDFKVGACVISDKIDNRMYTGCNVENAAYGSTICAERCAILKAVSEGARCIKAIAICGGRVNDDNLMKCDGYAFPCGACRQVMSEFRKDEDIVIIIAKSIDDYIETSLEELLPGAFSLVND